MRWFALVVLLWGCQDHLHASAGSGKILPPTFIDASLESRGMLSSKLSVNMILDNYHLYNNNTMDAENEVLAYITPWNRKGYEYAKMMASKIRWLAPVWFRIR